MAVRSKLLRLLSMADELDNVYSAASGETPLIKRLTMVNTGATDGAVYTLLKSVGMTPWYYTRADYIASGFGVDAETWLVLPPGGSLGFEVVGGPFHITVHGAELEGLAD